MNIPVLLSIRGRQSYSGQDPETVELVTEGTLTPWQQGWLLSYEESDLTGLEGVTTTFTAEPGQVTLTRKGPLCSQMVFRKGMSHDSLYQMDFGALMVTVTATEVTYELSENGGTIDLAYHIEIEQSAAGDIDYHLEVSPLPSN